DAQNVPRPGGPGPTDLAARPNDAAGERQSALNQEAHGDRGGVPAARRQSRKQRALRPLVVEVEGLRIELAGERLDLGRVDDMGRAREPPPDGEVLEIEAAFSPQFLWFRHRYLPRSSHLHNDSDCPILCQCSTRASRTCRVQSPAASRAWANGGACSTCATPRRGGRVCTSHKNVAARSQTCPAGRQLRRGGAGPPPRRRYRKSPPGDDFLWPARGRFSRPVLPALLAGGNRHFAPEGASVL